MTRSQAWYALIRWPDRYSPDRTAVHVSNEIDIPAPPEVVWAWLVRADLWPTWYSNSSMVKIYGGNELRAKTRFAWKTFGVALRSEVTEYEPPERLAWSADGTGVHAYHAWLIQRTPTGCHVKTEENQNGLLARMSSMARPGNMSKYHQLWLDKLREKAASGPPP